MINEVKIGELRDTLAAAANQDYEIVFAPYIAEKDKDEEDPAPWFRCFVTIQHGKDDQAENTYYVLLTFRKDSYRKFRSLDKMWKFLDEELTDFSDDSVELERNVKNKYNDLLNKYGSAKYLAKQ